MRQLLAVLALALAIHSTSATPQEARRGDPRKAIDSYERYLERKPYHDWAFDKLVEEAVSINELEPLVARWERRLERPCACRALPDRSAHAERPAVPGFPFRSTPAGTVRSQRRWRSV